MAHQVDQVNTSCLDCIYRYHYTITACSHTICTNCLHAAIGKKIQLQRGTFICPRCVDTHELTQVNQSQQQIQKLEIQLKRLTKENIHLINAGVSANVKIKVLSERINELLIENANLVRQACDNELLVKETQKEKEDLIRYNEQLEQSLPNFENKLNRFEDIFHQQLNENQASYLNEINGYKRRIAQLETDNEQCEKEICQLKQAIDFNKPTERENNDLQQQSIKANDEYKKQLDHLRTRYPFHENGFGQENEQLTHEKISEQHQYEESFHGELVEKNTKVDELRAELGESEARNNSTVSQLDGCQLFNNIQYLDHCFSLIRQIFELTIESSKQILSKEVETNNNGNDQQRIQTNNVVHI